IRFFLLLQMKVFKFGGASIKDSQAIRNVLHVLQTVGYTDSLIIASAMGKTTNALEDVVNAYFHKPEQLEQSIQLVRDYHLNLLQELFTEAHQEVYDKINGYFAEMDFFLKTNKSPNYNFVYDQIVVYGEIISTTILSCFFNTNHITNTWIDARNLVKTDTTYRDAQVDWQ